MRNTRTAARAALQLSEGSGYDEAVRFNDVTRRMLLLLLLLLLV